MTTSLTRPGPKTGVLLVNLGTPDAPETGAVRRYLREFLSDPRVLDIHPVGRWLLLNFVILPLRPARSAAAYRKVWTPRGSPLLVHGQDLRDGVAAALDAEAVPVELAMRYGQPSVAAALGRLRAAGCERIVTFPLYPQFASSTTGSSLEAVYRAASADWNPTWISAVPAFFDDPRFLAAFAQVAAPVLERVEPEHVVFSYHGLPERHIRKSDATGDVCGFADCCDDMGPHNRHCYRAQCFATTRGLARTLGLSAQQVTTSFQSRLGRDPWIRPYTDPILRELAERGVKRVAVLCPAFVADCLETVEEIGMASRAAFCEAGGDTLELVPSLNAHPAWVAAVVSIVRDHLQPHPPRAPLDVDVPMVGSGLR